MRARKIINAAGPRTLALPAAKLDRPLFYRLEIKCDYAVAIVFEKLRKCKNLGDAFLGHLLFSRLFEKTGDSGAPICDFSPTGRRRCQRWRRSPRDVLPARASSVPP